VRRGIDVVEFECGGSEAQTDVTLPFGNSAPQESSPS
jgi:hypothetical protein